MNVIAKLSKFYCDFHGVKGIIGYSVKNKPIYYFNVKKSNSPKIIVTYCIHAREYITTHLALKQIEDFAKYGRTGNVAFIPMVNPDGVEICLSKNRLFKANANGVDLNVNFDAMWGKGEQNEFAPNFQNYVGKMPFSEPETRALRDFTCSFLPDLTISYHSKGEEIYWEFFQEDRRLIRDYKFAKILSNSTTYPLKKAENSCGGYKDWCILTLKIPSFTIEVGSDKLSHPITTKHLSQIYAKNKRVLFDLTENYLCN